jgi:hydroxymethylpyrimidine pyrophosphatase-like HAD family hydrolase
MSFSDKTPPRQKGIIFTDFDGTLLNSSGFIAPDNYEALKAAGEAGYIRAIATGRSLFSFKKAVSRLERPIDDYIDFLIFSSGTAVLKTGSNEPDDLKNLDGNSAAETAALLFRHGIDFMIQSPAPLNHRMVHVKANGAVNPDFYRRINIYSEFSTPLTINGDESETEAIERLCMKGVSQIIAIIPPAGNQDNEKFSFQMLEFLRAKLPDCSIIRTTSPIDHRSLWIEFFNPEVSKSRAAERLALRFGLSAAECLAIGNDFNDEDLLSWAGTAYTVDEAHEELRKLFPSAGRSSGGAVASAIKSFIA